LLTAVWLAVGSCHDPMLKGVEVLSIDGGTEFVSARIARLRHGAEPHQ
jgi:hypothetical protein